ncbi:MAG: AI-2E family transporter [Candidatus Absconditabacteria bacterium]
MINSNDSVFNKIISVNVLLIGIFVFGYLLKLGAKILIPFTFAIFLTILIFSIYKRLKGKNVHKFFIILIMIFGFFGVGYFIYSIVRINYYSFLKEIPIYEYKFQTLFSSLSDIALKYDLKFENPISNINGQELMGSVFNTFRGFGTMIVMIVIYCAFFIFEKKNLYNKFVNIFGNKHEKTLVTIRENLEDYILFKTFISLMTGLATYLVLLLFGVKFAILWGLMTFLLNFIPTLGSIIAVIIVFLFALLQFTSFFIPVSLLILLSVVQFFFGNFLDPKMIGDKLNLSPIIIILSVIIMGALWGGVGMFLAVPMISTINIICQEIPAMKIVHYILRKD